MEVIRRQVVTNTDRVQYAHLRALSSNNRLVASSDDFPMISDREHHLIEITE
jgi:hypothetical protein